MRSSLYNIVFAAALGASCAILLTGAKELAADRVAANRRAEKVRHILAVLGAEYDPAAPADELVEVFEATVGESKRGALRVYTYPKGAASPAVAVPVEGRGLWGPIRGLLALEPDGRTIRDVTFYEQEETPGLGGEIGSEAFRRRFRGRVAVSAEGTSGVALVKPGAALAGANEIHAISGATMTCERVEAMVNATLAALEEEVPSDGE